MCANPDALHEQDLKEKAPLRAKFGLKDEWVLPYEVRTCCMPLLLTSLAPQAGMAVHDSAQVERRCCDLADSH